MRKLTDEEVWRVLGIKRVGFWERVQMVFWLNLKVIFAVLLLFFCLCNSSEFRERILDPEGYRLKLMGEK